jgi:hypothetical protein
VVVVVVMVVVMIVVMLLVVVVGANFLDRGGHLRGATREPCPC